MTKQILRGGEEDGRIVARKAEHGVAVITQQIADLVRSMAVIYVKATRFATRLIGSANLAAMVLREQHRIVMLWRNTVTLKPQSPTVDFSACDHVGALAIRLLSFGMTLGVATVGFSIPLSIRCLVSLLFGDLLRRFSPRQDVFAVPRVPRPVIQRVFVSVTTLTHVSDGITVS